MLTVAKALLAVCVIVGGWCLYRGILFDVPDVYQRAQWDQPELPVFTEGVLAWVCGFAVCLALGLAAWLYIRKARGDALK